MANDHSGPGDFTLGGDVPQPKVRVWIEPDQNAPPGCGRIMVAVDSPTDGVPASVVASGIPFLSKLFGVLKPASPSVSTSIVSKVAANDNIYWVGDHRDEGHGGSGVFGSDVDAATLVSGETVVAWIGDDNSVHATLLDADGRPKNAEASEDDDSKFDLNKLLANLGEAGQGAGAGSGRLKVSPLAQGGFAALWIADFGLTAALVGKAFVSQSNAAEPPTQEATPAHTWNVKTIAPVAVPAAAHSLMIAVHPDGELNVSLSMGAHGAHAAPTTLSFAVDAHGHDASFTLAAVSPEDVSKDHDAGPAVHIRHGASGQPAHTDAAAIVTAVPASQDTHDTASVETPASSNSAFGGASPPSGAIDPLSQPAAPQPAAPAAVPVRKVPHVQTAHTSVGAADGVTQAAPKMVVAGTGTPVLLYQEPGASVGTTTIKIVQLDTTGRPAVDANGDVHTTTVTSDAITADPANPALDLQPVITPTSDGVGVAWAQASPDGGTALVLQVFDSGCAPVADTPAVVATTGGAIVSISDFAIAAIKVAEHHHEDSAAPASHDGSAVGAPGGDAAPPAAADAGVGAGVPLPQADGTAAPAASGDAPPAASDAAPAAGDVPASTLQVAVVWVQNADDHGYGEINGQRLGIENDADDDGHHFVALGLDGHQGGDDDSAFGLSEEGGSSSGAIGRAPSVAAVSDDTLAVTWVRETSPGSGVEAVSGVVLNTENGAAVLSLDLAGLMPQGLVAGSEPQLLTSNAGDIVVGWTQACNGGGYDEAAAVYHSVGHDQWTPPSNVLILAHFDKLPNFVSMTLSDSGEPQILVTWKDDSHSISGATFDLAGNATGDTFTYHSGEGHGSGDSGGHGGGSDSGSDHGPGDSFDGNTGDLGSVADFGGVSAAILPDGHILVIFGQSGSSGSDDSSIGGALISYVAPDDASSATPPDATAADHASDAVVDTVSALMPAALLDTPSNDLGAALDTGPSGGPGSSSSDTSSSGGPDASSHGTDSSGGPGNSSYDTDSTGGPGSPSIDTSSSHDTDSSGSPRSSSLDTGSLGSPGGPSLGSGSSSGTGNSSFDTDSVHETGSSGGPGPLADTGFSGSSPGGPSADAHVAADLAVTPSDNAYVASLTSWLPTQVAVADEESDQIVMVPSGGGRDGAGIRILNSGSSSSNSGSGDGHQDQGHDDANEHLGQSDDGDNDHDHSDDNHSHDDRDLDHQGDHGGGNHGSAEKLIFVSGYGNDIADYHDEDHLFDHLGGASGASADPMAEAFDALQFANALSHSGNMEVITFDTSNVAIIKDFEML